MSSFYVIEVTNRANQTAYVVDGEKELQFCLEPLAQGVSRFSTHSKAKTFWDEKNLDKYGTVYIRTNEYIEKKEKERVEAAANAQLYYLETETGEKLFQDPQGQKYYFDKGDAGFCVSKSKENLQKLIEYNKLEGKVTIKVLPKQNPNLKVIK